MNTFSAPVDVSGAVSLRALRRASRRGALSALNAAVLDSADPLWRDHSYDRRWRQLHSEYAAFIVEHGHGPSQTSKNVEERRLGVWRAAQRRARQHKTLAPYRLDILNTTVGHRWDVFDEGWDRSFLMLQNFWSEHGVAPSKGGVTPEEKLGARWLHQQRQLKRGGTLIAERDVKLTELLGCGWELPADLWNLAFEKYRMFLGAHGRTPRKSCADAGEQVVGEWMHNQRTFYRRQGLSAERVAALETIPGHVWNAR